MSQAEQAEMQRRMDKKDEALRWLETRLNSLIAFSAWDSEDHRVHKKELLAAIKAALEES